jgi:hypothetical protein
VASSRLRLLAVLVVDSFARNELSKGPADDAAEGLALGPSDRTHVVGEGTRETEIETGVGLCVRRHGGRLPDAPTMVAIVEEQAERRVLLDDLFTRAQALGVGLRPRMRREWTGLGFLAPSTPDGRSGVGRGVGRYWTRGQLVVFEVVLAGYHAGKPRWQLANVPIAFWLLLADGDQYVPLVQVRRAVATFASAAWTRQRLEDVVHRRVRSAPAAARAERKLVERLEGLLDHELAVALADGSLALPAWLADQETRVALPAGVERQAAVEIAADLEAGRRGLKLYGGASDDAYRAARARYREWATYYPPALVEQAGGLQHRWGELSENACADLLMELGRAAS